MEPNLREVRAKQGRCRFPIKKFAPRCRNDHFRAEKIFLIYTCFNTRRKDDFLAGAVQSRKQRFEFSIPLVVYSGTSIETKEKERNGAALSADRVLSNSSDPSGSFPVSCRFEPFGIVGTAGRFVAAFLFHLSPVPRHRVAD